MQKPKNTPKQSKAATKIKLRLKVIFWKFDMPRSRYFIFILKEGPQKFDHFFQGQILLTLLSGNLHSKTDHDLITVMLTGRSIVYVSLKK